MELKDKLTFDDVQFSKETPRTLDEILDSPELGILLALKNKED